MAIASTARTAWAAVATAGLRSDHEGQAGGHQHRGDDGQRRPVLEPHPAGEQPAEAE